MTPSKHLLRRQLATGEDAESLALLRAAHSDDAADVLAELPEPRRRALLDALPERQRRRIAVLAGDEPAIAGALMSTDFLAFYSDATIAHALDRVRTCGLDAAATAVVYVANRERQLIGSLNYKDLLGCPPDAQLHHVMQVGPKRLRTGAGFEEIARLITDDDLLVAPVVDDEHHIVGIITADDVLEVLMPERWRRHPRTRDADA
jgi:Mg/Co/Ni transporter MgtE